MNKRRSSLVLALVFLSAINLLTASDNRSLPTVADVVELMRERSALTEPIQLVAKVEKRYLRDGVRVRTEREWLRLVGVPSGTEFRLDYVFDSPTGKGIRAMWSCVQKDGLGLRLSRGVAEKELPLIYQGDFSRLKAWPKQSGSETIPGIGYLYRAFGFKTSILESAIQAEDLSFRWEAGQRGERVTVRNEPFQFVYDLSKQIPLTRTMLGNGNRVVERITVKDVFLADAIWLPSKVRAQSFFARDGDYEIDSFYTVDEKQSGVISGEEFSRLLDEVVELSDELNDGP
ncbi:MAG: hypothetical protein AAGD22_02190 [Verrucomicrobiota bacterium]